MFVHKKLCPVFLSIKINEPHFCYLMHSVPVKHHSAWSQPAKAGNDQAETKLKMSYGIKEEWAGLRLLDKFGCPHKMVNHGGYKEDSF